MAHVTKTTFRSHIQKKANIFMKICYRVCVVHVYCCLMTSFHKILFLISKIERSSNKQCCLRWISFSFLVGKLTELLNFWICATNENCSWKLLFVLFLIDFKLEQKRLQHQRKNISKERLTSLRFWNEILKFCEYYDQTILNPYLG